MMQVPLAAGIGFISAVYYNLSPVTQSQVCFNSSKQLTSPVPNIMKYELILFNNVRWPIYATVQDGQTFELTMKDLNHLCYIGSTLLADLGLDHNFNPVQEFENIDSVL